MNERWCEYPGCQDVRTLPRGKRFCAYHELVFTNASDELRADVQRIIEFRTRAASTGAVHYEAVDLFDSFMKTTMTANARKKIAAAAHARWAKMRAEPEHKNGAEVKSAPNHAIQIPTIPRPLKHPLAGKIWTLEIQHAQMRASQTNPRTIFTEEAIRELADDFKLNGQLQRCVVRVDPNWAKKEAASKNAGTAARRLALLTLAGEPPDGHSAPALRPIDDVVNDPDTQFEIICGERRWRAAGPKFAALKKIAVEVVCMTDEQAIKAQYAENARRKDLTALEEARWFSKLIESKQFTPESLAEKLGKSRTYIFEKVKLTRLAGPAMKAFEEGKISASLAAVIAKVPDPDAQALLFKKDRWGNTPVFDREGLAESVRSVEGWIDKNLIRQIPWKLDEEFKHAKSVAPQCRTCPKMSRNIGEDPNAAKGPPRCLGLTCFEERSKAIAAQRKQQANEQGKEFWTPEMLNDRRYDSAFVIEGKDVYDGKSYKPVEKIAGTLEHAILAENGDGQVVRVWKREALVKAGRMEKERSYSSGPSAADRAKAIFEAKVENRIIEEVLKKIETDGWYDSVDLWRQLAHGCLASLWHDNIVKIAKRREVDREAIREASYVETFGPAKCVSVLVECLLMRGLRGGADEYSEKAVKWAGVDVKKIREEVKAAEQEKKATKGKGAKAAKPVQTEIGEFLDSIAAKNVSASGLMADHPPKIAHGQLAVVP